MVARKVFHLRNHLMMMITKRVKSVDAVERVVKRAPMLVSPGLSVERATRPPYTPDRPSRPPDKGQTGID
jgi:hypothetical protein